VARESTWYWTQIAWGGQTFYLVRSDAGLTRVTLPGESFAEVVAYARRHAPGAALKEDGAALAPWAEELVAYLAGHGRTFTAPLDLRGTRFQRAVWEAIRAIPYGERRTYGELAVALGQPSAARAVGRATGANPVPFMVPCHRVVARAGLGGYAGGLLLKAWLLAREAGHPVPDRLPQAR